MSSISSIAIETDAWGIDVAVSGSQKGWMAPPGIALVSVSERAWAQQASARSPRFYFDWKEAKTWAEKGMTPFTPAVGVAFALQEGLRMLEEEGLEQVYERHARLARATQAGLHALGFQLYAKEGFRSNTVTSAVPPPAGRGRASQSSWTAYGSGSRRPGQDGRKDGPVASRSGRGVSGPVLGLEQEPGIDIAPAEGARSRPSPIRLQGVAAATR